MKKDTLLLGSHLSTAGGYEQALIKGASIGCTAVQIFTKSSRQWLAKPIDQEQVLLFKNTLQFNPSISLVLAHASYLINIASTNDLLEQKSTTALLDELERCALLGIPYLVLHPGTHPLEKLEEGLHKVIKNLNFVLEKSTASTCILLENTAGQGSSIGATFEQLRTIYDGITNKQRIGFCFDTCHAFAAGYDFTTQESYYAMWNTVDTILGIANIKAFHLNDSLKNCGSRVDRHAHIGQGKIGLEGFRLIMNDKRFFSIPKILETPKSSTDLLDDSKNMQLLKDSITEETRKYLGI